MLSNIRLPASLATICATSQVISAEALAIHNPNMGLVKKLNGLFSDTIEFIEEKVSALAPLPPTTAEEEARKMKAMGFKSVIDFGHIADVLVPVPAGLSVTWLEYISILEEAQVITTGLYDNVLEPFAAYLGALVNDPSKLEDRTGSARVKLTNLTDVQKQLAKAFKNGKKDAVRLDKCIKRNKDWIEVEEKLIELNTKQRIVTPQLLKDKVAGIESIIEVLFEQINDPNNEYRLNTTAINAMSTLSFGVAEQVAFYSAISGQITQLNSSVQGAKDIIKKMQG